MQLFQLLPDGRCSGLSLPSSSSTAEQHSSSGLPGPAGRCLAPAQASSLHVGLPDLAADGLEPGEEGLEDEVTANLHARFKKDHIYVS